MGGERDPDRSRPGSDPFDRPRARLTLKLVVAVIAFALFDVGAQTQLLLHGYGGTVEFYTLSALGLSAPVCYALWLSRVNKR